jgi:D-glycero-alpha-D-manno-heptose-7-phosphate kinase
VEPLRISQKRRQELLNHLVLLNTGISRNSSQITHGLIQNISIGKSHLKSIYNLAVESRQSLISNSPMRDLGILLRESWFYKVLSNPLSTNEKTELVLEQAISSGALGGKLLGAGGGGFMILMVEPKHREKVLDSLKLRFKELTEIPFGLDGEGSKCLYFEKNKNDFRSL